MLHIDQSVHVEAPPERVWAFVSDVRRCPEWVTFADEMGHVDESDPGVGFRYVEYDGVGHLRSESEWRIVEFDPPRRQIHVGDMGIVDGEQTITVEPDSEGTRWTRTVELEVLPRLHPVGRLLDRVIVRRRMARGLARTMAAGKAIIEREERERTASEGIAAA